MTESPTLSGEPGELHSFGDRTAGLKPPGESAIVFAVQPLRTSPDKPCVKSRLSSRAGVFWLSGRITVVHAKTGARKSRFRFG
jgi:hypothetical protein